MLRLLCLAALLFASDSYAKENQTHKGHKAGAAERKQILPNFPAFGAIGLPITVIEEKEDDTLWKNEECPNAKSHDEADLCEQRRMSKSAEQSVGLNIIQVAIGVAGFVLLVVTLKLTRISTKAAVDAAQASIEAWQEQRRPYVFVSGVATLGYEGTNFSPEALKDFPGLAYVGTVEYFVRNHGAVPAIIKEARAGFIIKDGKQKTPIPHEIWEDNPLFIDHIISADERRGPIKESTIQCLTAGEEDSPGDALGVRVFDERGADWIDVSPSFKKPGLQLIFRVVITYRGPFTDGHETSACWRYDTVLQQFEKTGPEENYER